MATRTEILAARASAGAVYAAALAALRSALIELAAYDQAAANAAVGAHVRSFGEVPDAIPFGMRHPEFAAVGEAGNLHDAIRARRDELIATVTG